MSKTPFLAVIAATLAATLYSNQVLRADAYAPPVCDSVWAYVYAGDKATYDPDGYSYRSLDGTWQWACGSNDWDGTAPGVGKPGGVGAFSDPDGTTFLRMQDSGDPTKYGYVVPTSKKFMFGHNIAGDVGDDLSRTILDDGVTLCFRVRLSTAAAGSSLDDQYPSNASGIVPWPAGGDGYLEIWSIRQDLGDQLILFGLALATDKADNTSDVMGGKQGLTMNRLNGVVPNNKSNPNNTSSSGLGTMNILDMSSMDLTAWHEFWITIRKGGTGTHQVTVWLDGSLTPAGTFDVTSYSEQDYVYNAISMGEGYSNASGSVDVDFFKYALGAYPPTATTCLLTVDPGISQTVSATRNTPADSVTYTISNCPANTGALTYAVEELDDTQTPADVPWLSVSKTGGTVAVGGSDSVVATLDTSIASGPHTAYLKFTDTCDPSNVTIRRIDLNVLAWNVSDCYETYRAHLLDYSSAAIAPATYRITNGSAADLPYSVTVDQTWLTLDSAGGTIPAGGSADVTGTINPLGLAGGNKYTAKLTFTNTQDLTTVVRRVRLNVVAATKAFTFTYRGNVDPTDDDSAGVGLKFSVRGVANGTTIPEGITAAVETDPNARNRRVWHVTDASIDEGLIYETRTGPGTGSSITIEAEVGATVLARFKVNNWAVDRGPQLFIWDGSSDSGLTAFGHWGGLDGHMEELLRNAACSAAGSDGFVTVRMSSIGRNVADVLCSRKVRIYLNEEPTPLIETNVVEWTNGSSAVKEGFGFGAGSDTGTMDVAFDWVSGTNAGAFAPGEEVAVIGRSLIPEFCHIPFADVDLDSDVDQADFAIFQVCLGAAAPLGEACKCFDRPEPGFPEGNGAIDASDLTAFEACASGPGLPSAQSCE